MIITIDGTSGSGKSTVAEIFSTNIKLKLLNTGSLYRAITRECIIRKVDVSEKIKIITIAKTCDFNIIDKNLLYTESVSELVPAIAKISEVRSIVRDYQKEFSKTAKIVVEGRDIGTVVFPNAEIKFYITASAEIRAKRRYEQIKDIDKDRTISPLKIPSGAIVIDSSDMTIDQVVDVMEDEYHKVL